MFWSLSGVIKQISWSLHLKAIRKGWASLAKRINSKLSAQAKSDYSCNASPSDHLAGGTGSWWRVNRYGVPNPSITETEHMFLRLFIKHGEVRFEMFCQYCTCWTNYPEKVEEGLGDNDAVANISDVRTAGILLAQQYIRTSLVSLLTYLLTNNLFAVDSNGVIWTINKRPRSLSCLSKSSNCFLCPNPSSLRSHCWCCQLFPRCAMHLFFNVYL